MKMLLTLIQHTMNPHISFVDFDKDVLDKINEMNGLINKDDIVAYYAIHCIQLPNDVKREIGKYL